VLAEPNRKWVVSHSPRVQSAQTPPLVADDIEALIRRLKADLAGEIEVAGPELARKSDRPLVSSMSIDFTSTPSCLVEASHFFRRPPGRRSALWRAIGLARP